MEEIVTVDGRQFKLSVDRPLNATERAQVLTEIRKQTGCSTCHQPRTLSTGGVYSLPFDSDVTGTTTATVKNSGSTVTLTAGPSGGTRPYTVRFWRSNTGVAPIAVGSAHTTAAGDTEGTTVADSYVILDVDVAAAIGNTTAGTPLAVDIATGAIALGGTAAELATGSIRFYSSVVDSCPGTDKGTCAQYVDVVVTCVAPTCNFVVT